MASGEAGAGGDRQGVGEAAGAYATQSGATESVTLAMVASLALLLIAGGWFGKARDWVFAATGKGSSSSAAPATAGSSGQSGFDQGSAGGGVGGGGGGTF